MKPYEKDYNLLVPWFLMASYAYYDLKDDIMSDCEFDYITILLKKNWKKVKHPHKKLITLDMLNASTGYSIKYTNMIKYATTDYLEYLASQKADISKGKR